MTPAGRFQAPGAREHPLFRGPRHVLGWRHVAAGTFMLVPLAHSTTGHKVPGRAIEVLCGCLSVLGIPGSRLGSLTTVSRPGPTASDRGVRLGKSGRTCSGHTWAISHEHLRLLAVTHEHSIQRACRNVAPGGPVPAPPTFQASDIPARTPVLVGKSAVAAAR